MACKKATKCLCFKVDKCSFRIDNSYRKRSDTGHGLACADVENKAVGESLARQGMATTRQRTAMGYRLIDVIDCKSPC